MEKWPRSLQLNLSFIVDHIAFKCNSKQIAYHTRSMFEIALGNKAFKFKNNFLEKASFLSFSQKCIFAIFRVKKLMKYFWNFLPSKPAICLAVF